MEKKSKKNYFQKIYFFSSQDHPKGGPANWVTRRGEPLNRKSPALIIIIIIIIIIHI